MLQRKTSATPETVISRLPPRSRVFPRYFRSELHAVTARAFPISNKNFSNHFSCNLKHTSSSIIQDHLKIFLIHHRDAVHTLGRLNLDLNRKQPKTQHRSRLSRFLLNLFNLKSIVIYGQSPHLHRSNKPKTKTF